MSTASDQKHFRSTLRAKQKSSLSTGNVNLDSDVAKMQSDFHFTDLVTGFNGFVNNFNKIEVKTKYPKLFMWSQGVQRFRKFDISDETMKIIKKLEETRPKKIYSKQSPSKEDKLKNLSQDEPIKIDSEAQAEVTNLTKDYSTRKSNDDKSSPTISMKTKKMNLTSTFQKMKPKKSVAEFKPIDITKFDFTLPIRPRTTLNVTKIQTETLLKSIGKASKPNTAQTRFVSVKTPKNDTLTGFMPQSTKNRNIPDIADNEYLLNHFDRRNIQINKILLQIKPDQDLLDKEEIIKTTISKIDKATRPFKSARGHPKKKEEPESTSEFDDSSREYEKLAPAEVMKNTTSKNGFSLKKSVSLPKKFSAAPRLKSIDDFKKPEIDLRRPQTSLNIHDQFSNALDRIERAYEPSGLNTVSHLGTSSYNQFNRMESRESAKLSIGPDTKTTAKDVITEFNRDRPSTVGDMNLFEYDQYFKKKYLQRGFRLDYSKGLSNKMKNWQSNITKSRKRVDLIFEQKKPAEDIIEASQ